MYRGGLAPPGHRLGTRSSDSNLSAARTVASSGPAARPVAGSPTVAPEGPDDPVLDVLRPPRGEPGREDGEPGPVAGAVQENPPGQGGDVLEGPGLGPDGHAEEPVFQRPESRTRKRGLQRHSPRRAFGYPH